MRIERGSKSRRAVSPVETLMTIIIGALIVWSLLSAIDLHMSHIDRSRTTAIKESTNDNKTIHPSRF
jgi:hypothetical protein